MCGEFDDPTQYDPRAAADLLLDYYRDHSSCPSCAFPDPEQLEGRYCNRCTGEGHLMFLETRLARLAREAGVA